MSNHTPGPWYRDNEGYIWRRPLSELYEYGGRVLGDKPVAAVWKGWDGEGQTGYPVEANARLIAAAPEMCELIQELSNTWWNDCQFIPSDTEAAWALSNKLARLATSASQLLDKIEGGNNE